MSISRKHFEEIAANLREARMLGLFESDNAHRIVVENLAHTFEKLNPLFDGEKFARACGVHDATDTVFPAVKWATAGSIQNGRVTTMVISDEPEYVIDCD